jgi:type III secretory pathway lipoprotein EscJ
LLFACSQKQSIESALGLPTDARTNYLTPIDREDLSYSNMKRIQIRAMVPRGLDTTQILNNIKSLVCDAYNELKPDRISILLYKIGDDMKSSYTVAKGEYTPNGEWNSDIKTDDLSVYKFRPPDLA